MSIKEDKEQIMIEYHDLNSIKTITLSEFQIKKQELVDAIINLIQNENNNNLSKYIAIDFDTEQYFIPIIITGIIDSKKFSFVFNAKGKDLFSQLTINLIFSHQLRANHDSIFEFKIGTKTIHLLKSRIQKVKGEYSVKSLSSSPLRFYYAIATSGTTGAPKIVQVTEDCITSNILDFSQLLNVSSEDKIAQLTPLTFDPSMVEIFLSLKHSCTLFMVSNKVKNNPQLLLEKMKQNQVTIFQTTPSLLLNRWSRQNLKLLFSSDSKLRVLLLGGEPFLKPELISEIREKGNPTRFFNVYGITEVSCWASLYEFSGDSRMTDFIGEPLSDTLFEVKSGENDDIIQHGEGILHIGSSKRITQIDNETISLKNLPIYRSTGDIVKIESSKIYYKGRSDSTIKRLGQRVNLSKLESHAESSEVIAKCATIWDERFNKLHLIVSPVSTIYDPADLKSELRRHLRSLEDCYQPDEIHCLNTFPLTEHGKICKFTLKKIAGQRLKPLDNLDHLLRTIWEDQLGSEIDDGFLNLGGNSISAFQMSNEISDLYNLDVSKLINIFLSNAKFSDILNMIKTELDRRKKGETKNLNEIDKEQIFQKQEFSQQRALDLDGNIDEQFKNLKCLWQKNRGDDSASRFDCQIEGIVVDKTHDLKKCVDASPTIFECSNGKKFVTVGSHSGIICTISLNLDSTECYEIKLPDRIEASVLVLDNFRGVVGCYDGNIYCLQLNTGDIVWKFQTDNTVKCTAVGCQSQECIFVGSYDTHMYCLNMKDGVMRWRTKVSSGSLTAKPRMNLSNKLLLVASLDGTCAALDIISGQIKWTKKFDHPIFSSPALLQSGNVIVCTVTGDIICINIHLNSELWTYSTRLNIFSYPIIHLDPTSGCENILVTAQDTLFCLQCTDGSETAAPSLRYKIKLRGTTFCTPWCEGNIVVLADSTGIVQILNFHDGISLAEIKLNGEIFSSPVLCNDKIVIGCRDDLLYQLKILHD